MQIKIIKFSLVSLVLGILLVGLCFILLNCGSGSTIKTYLTDTGPWAIQFDGNDGNPQYAGCGKFSFPIDNTPITVEAWVKPDTKLRGCIVRSGKKKYGYFLYIDNTVKFRVNDNNNVHIVDSNINIRDNQWHHVAGVLANDDHGTSTLTFTHPTTTSTCTIAARDRIPHLDIYVDGQFANCATSTYITQTPANAAETIGWDSVQINDPALIYAFKGIIDEVRLWKESRSSSLILAGRDTEITPLNWGTLNPKGTLKAYWRLNDGVGDKAADTSGETLNDLSKEVCIQQCSD